MVKLHTSLLAITLVMGSALPVAARHRHHHANVNHASASNQHASASGQRPLSQDLTQEVPGAHYRGMQSETMAKFLRAPKIREPVDKDLIVRNLDVSDDLESREPRGGRAGLIKTVIRTIKNHGSTAFNVASTGAMVYGAVASRRDLEDSEDLLERDLDVEELFGREYDHLDERDIIDDEDLFVRDLEAEEFYGREYNLLDE